MMRASLLICGVVMALLAGCTSGGGPGVKPSPVSSPSTSNSPSARSPLTSTTSPAGAASTANTSPAGRLSPGATTWQVVALGDSVPEGAACNCTPYPQLSASDLS